MRHGELPSPQLPPPGHEDPAVFLVFADMESWMLAHPCSCEAMCECEDT